METKKYRLNFWIKFLFLMILTTTMFLLKNVYFHSKEVLVNEKNKNIITTSPSYKSISVLYKDSVYQVLDVESFLSFILIRNGFSLDDIISNSFCDTILIDSVVYNQVKHSIVYPQSQIDSVYKIKGIEYLLKMYFEDDNPRIPRQFKECDSLPQKYELDLRHVMNILVRAGVTIYQDCESGYPVLSCRRQYN